MRARPCLDARQSLPRTQAHRHPPPLLLISNSAGNGGDTPAAPPAAPAAPAAPPTPPAPPSPAEPVFDALPHPHLLALLAVVLAAAALALALIACLRTSAAPASGPASGHASVHPTWGGDSDVVVQRRETAFGIPLGRPSTAGYQSVEMARAPGH